MIDNGNYCDVIVEAAFAVFLRIPCISRGRLIFIWYGIYLLEKGNLTERESGEIMSQLL